MGGCWSKTTKEVGDGFGRIGDAFKSDKDPYAKEGALDKRIASAGIDVADSIKLARAELVAFGQALRPFEAAYQKGPFSKGLELPQLAAWTNSNFCGSEEGGKKLHDHAAHIAAMAELKQKQVAQVKQGFVKECDAVHAELQGGLASCKGYIDAELLVVTVTKKLEAAKNKAERDRAQQQKDLDAGLEKKYEKNARVVAKDDENVASLEAQLATAEGNVPTTLAAADLKAPQAMKDAGIKLKKAVLALRASHTAFTTKVDTLLEDTTKVRLFDTYAPKPARESKSMPWQATRDSKTISAADTVHVKDLLTAADKALDYTRNALNLFVKPSSLNGYLTVHGPKEEHEKLQTFRAALPSSVYDESSGLKDLLAGVEVPGLTSKQDDFSRAVNAYLHELADFKAGLSATAELLKAHHQAAAEHAAMQKKWEAASGTAADSDRLAELKTSREAAKKKVEAAVRGLSDEALPEVGFPEKSLSMTKEESVQLTKQLTGFFKTTFDDAGNPETSNTSATSVPPSPPPSPGPENEDSFVSIKLTRPRQHSSDRSSSAASVHSKSDASRASANPVSPPPSPAGPEPSLPPSIVSVKTVMDGTEAFVGALISFYTARVSSILSEATLAAEGFSDSATPI